jgi:BirA family biotin operon repressor/biotin-[acetyl-CoA-carboxylase] ligase
MLMSGLIVNDGTTDYPALSTYTSPWFTLESGKNVADRAPVIFSIELPVTAGNEYQEKKTSIKWVNDLYFHGGKVGGILTEAVTRADGRHRMVVGLGINLSTTDFPDDLRAPAASLFSLSEAYAVTDHLIYTLAGEIARRLLELAEVFPPPPDFPDGARGKACLDFYRRHLLYVDQPVTCTHGNEVFEGILRGVDEDYALLVERDGEIFPLSSGEISVRPAQRPIKKA